MQPVTYLVPEVFLWSLPLRSWNIHTIAFHQGLRGRKQDFDRQQVEKKLAGHAAFGRITVSAG
jgi:hypothetical protein